MAPSSLSSFDQETLDLQNNFKMSVLGTIVVQNLAHLFNPGIESRVVGLQFIGGQNLKTSGPIEFTSQILQCRPRFHLKV